MFIKIQIKVKCICRYGDVKKMNKVELNGKWNLVGLSPEGEKVELFADVPGSALSAILNSDIENNLNVFYRDNADKVQKYERYSWIYSKIFEIYNLDNKMELVLENPDTYCDIYVNDKHIAYCENAHISYRFDISNALKVGTNRVDIYFYSSVLRVLGKKEREASFAKDRMYTRRQQFSYGWDWAMRFVTCGIGNVYIEKLDAEIKVESAYVYTKHIDSDAAEIVVDIDFMDYDLGGIIDVSIIDSNGTIVTHYIRYNEEEFMRVNLDIENPKLWYPNGYGKQELYTLCIKCGDRILYKTPFGIRTVKILEIQDKEGSENYKKCTELKKTKFSMDFDNNVEFSGFILKINNEKILCKGANWVPCEPFSNGCSDKKVTSILELAARAGVNMIRIWGGGSFETEHFYDECSRLGIMVTQDFLMACGKYPEDDEGFLEQLKKEAEYAVKLIRNKSCLVWWSGDNENAVSGCDLDTNYTGRASAYKAIAPIVYKKDYNRRFLPSSPYGGAKYASNTVGTTHNTQFLSCFYPYMLQEDVSDYKDYFKLYTARFIAEEPVLGASSENCLKQFMTEEDIYGENLDMWFYHTRTNPALKHEVFEYAYSFAQGILGKFKDGKDRFFKLKYLQYEWLRVSLERVRREKWFCSGVVYWMLNDCWPAAVGWSLIDYYGEPKAAYYSFKRGAKQVVLSIDKEQDLYKFHICNDGKAETVSLKWYIISSDGKIIKENEIKGIDVPKNTSFVACEVNNERIPKGCFLVADIIGDGNVSDRAFYKKGNLEIRPFNGKMFSLKTDGTSVIIKSQSYIHAVELCGDAVFEDNYFSMLPGEERKISYTTTGESRVYAEVYTI